MNQVFKHLHLPPDLAIEFMAVFSRFEHALKSTNYAIGSENRVDAAWDRFANDIDARFNDIQDDHLTQCVDFLMTEPPRKQVLDGNRTRFQDQTVDPNQKTTQQLLRFVRTVRNNLFHGGKYLPNGEVEVGRNQKLVESALYVLQICVGIDQQVLSSFEQ
jgi:hypothetical protein